MDNKLTKPKRSLKTKEHVGDTVYLSNTNTTIEIANMRELNGRLVVLDREGNIYDESEVQLTFIKSSAEVMYDFLNGWSLTINTDVKIPVEFLYTKMYKDFINLLSCHDMLN